MDTLDHGDESEPEGKGKATRARQPRGAKSPSDAGKRSLNLRVDDETYERLTIHAMRRRTTISALVMDFFDPPDRGPIGQSGASGMTRRPDDRPELGLGRPSSLGSPGQGAHL